MCNASTRYRVRRNPTRCDICVTHQPGTEPGVTLKITAARFAEREAWFLSYADVNGSRVRAFVGEQFVHDKSRAEVMAVGLQTVREMCTRCPLVMQPELLQVRRRPGDNLRHLIIITTSRGSE